MKVIICNITSKVLIFVVLAMFCACGNSKNKSETKKDEFTKDCCKCTGTGKIQEANGYTNCSLCYGLGKLKDGLWDSHCR